MFGLFRSRAPRPVAAMHLDVAHDGETYRVALKRVATARRFTLRVRAATRDVVLTIPPRGSLIAAREFAARHAAWIGARMARLPQTIALLPGAHFPLRGVEHLIVRRPRASGCGAVWIEPGDNGAPLLCVTGDAGHAERRIRDYLKRQARIDLAAAVARHTAALGLPARPVGLRDTTSRWGSCSAAGSLNFSWRLIMAPAYVLDYLAAHEAAHLIHLDHSPKFWAVARRLSPDVDRAEIWLKAHGASLHQFGVKAKG
jgi:predicted metal-dependent hydrolase